MRTSDFHYRLPPALIARHPVEPRSASRLMLVDGGARGAHRDLRFGDLPALLKPSDLLVFNDTRVIPARLIGAKQTGGRVEALIERVLDAHRALAQVRESKPPRTGTRLDFEGGVGARVAGRRGEFYELAFESDAPVVELLERAGHVPLPPYLARPDEPADRVRYQTVYARQPGAIAAPTAGLHFDQPLLERLETLGVELGWLTLHIGAGTFQPVRVAHVAQHRMHLERVRLGARLCEQVNAAREAHRRVVAVGTTVVRALETAVGADERLAPFEGETDLFIYPGYRFRAVDALLTNFHLPGSTLLMLVCAFGGTATVLAAYRHAVEQKYRFYSYGDAMFVTPERQVPSSRVNSPFSCHW